MENIAALHPLVGLSQKASEDRESRVQYIPPCLKCVRPYRYWSLLIVGIQEFYQLKHTNE